MLLTLSLMKPIEVKPIERKKQKMYRKKENINRYREIEHYSLMASVVFYVIMK